MKRKVYFQISIILYIFLSIILAIFAAAVYAIIWMLTDGLGTATVWEWAGFAAAIFAIGYMGYTIIRMAKNRIVLTDKEIYVPDHWGSKDYKIQYETHIAYSEILDIFIISSNNNSLNQPIRWATPCMPYIIVNCKGGQQKAINVFYYSKKQVVRIIDETIERSKLVGNEVVIKSGSEILKEFLEKEKSFSRMKKKVTFFSKSQ